MMILSNFQTASGPTQWLRAENGTVAEIGNGSCPYAESQDLGGAYLMPAFIDSHCHIIPMGLDLLKLHLGTFKTREEILDALRDWEREMPPGKWLHAVHYDQTKFADMQHLSAAELDQISTERPILIRSVNGHASVANSKALSEAGIDESTTDPTGGTYVRDASGKLSGVLLERAHEYVSNRAPAPTLEEMVDSIHSVARLYHSMGICSATDMMTGRWDIRQEIAAYKLAAEQGCGLRMHLFCQWSQVLGPRGIGADRLRELDGTMDHDWCRIGGLKIFADGAIGAATAAIYGAYRSTGQSGMLIYPAERLQNMVREGDANGFTVAIHSIGDRSTDAVLDAFEQTSNPARHRLEHAMILSDDQIERISKLNPLVTMQPEFLHRFGHAYKAQLGPEVASRLLRMRSVQDKGIRLSLSSDAPIVLGDPWIGVDSASNRPVGFDPAENLTRLEAIRAYTECANEANGAPNLGGVLAVGAPADFQVLDAHPITTVRPNLQQLIIGGKTVSSR